MYANADTGGGGKRSNLTLPLRLFEAALRDSQDEILHDELTVGIILFTC